MQDLWILGLPGADKQFLLVFQGSFHITAGKPQPGTVAPDVSVVVMRPQRGRLCQELVRGTRALVPVSQLEPEADDGAARPAQPGFGAETLCHLLRLEREAETLTQIAVHALGGLGEIRVAANRREQDVASERDLKPALDVCRALR